MTQLIPNGKQQFVDINGRPLVGGKVYFYSVGTSTPKNTYQDVGETILNTNPVILDARGQASIYGTGRYRQVLRDAFGSLIWDQVIADASLVVQENLDAFQVALAAPGGSKLTGWKREDLLLAITNVHQMLDAQSYSIWEFADQIISKPSADPGTWDWSPAFQAAFNLAGLKGLNIVVPAGLYKCATAITINPAITGASGVSINGIGSARDCQIQYSGAGYFLNVLGTGAEDASPITRFTIKNLWINGNANTTSTGGLNLKRIYIVRIQDVMCTNFAGGTANSVSIRNCFNVEWDGGQIANGFPLPAGTHALILGSELPDAWNTSNVIFRNSLIQYAGGNGVKVIQEGNIFDNLTFDNISFGKNASYSFSSDSPNVNNVSFRNCHLESPGYNGTATPIPSTGHIFMSNGTSLHVDNNSFQDALIYILLDSVRAFNIGGGNKFFESGFYTLTGNEMLRLRTSAGNCIGFWGENEVRTDQIDVLFNLVETGGFRIDLGRRTHTMTTEAFWNSEIFTNPLDYKGTIVDRYQSTNAPFDRMVSDGAIWRRYILSSGYKGERTTIPTTNETSGSWYANTSGAVSGPPGAQYNVFAWRTSGGGVWYELRMLTGT